MWNYGLHGSGNTHPLGLLKVCWSMGCRDNNVRNLDRGKASFLQRWRHRVFVHWEAKEHRSFQVGLHWDFWVRVFNHHSLARSLLERLLQPNPIDRYSVAKALQHPWITRKQSDRIPKTMKEMVHSFETESTLKSVRFAHPHSISKLCSFYPWSRRERILELLSPLLNQSLTFLKTTRN